MLWTKIHAIWEPFIVYFILILREAVIQCQHNSSKQHYTKPKTGSLKAMFLHKNRFPVLQSEGTKVDQKPQKVRTTFSYPLASFCYSESSKDPYLILE